MHSTYDNKISRVHNASHQQDVPHDRLLTTAAELQGKQLHKSFW